MTDNPYDILGVKPEASDKEIKAAYRRLAKELHPDLNPGEKDTEERFKSVSGAYNFLKDKEQRARFDRGEIDASGAEKPQNQSYRSYAGADSGNPYYNTRGFSDFANESDLFEELFGRTRGGGTRYSQAPTKGADVQYRLEVDFLDAALGAKRRVTMPDGVTIDVAIPAGVVNDQTLRLKGKGMPGPNGMENGDAYIKVGIAPHPYFTRKGQNVSIELPITLDEAVLGGKINVPTIHGPVSMNVPPGANSGQTLRLKGKGIKQAKTQQAGDQLVTLKVVLPQKPDEELKDYMRTWREQHAYKVRQAYEGDH